jgi:hypothetical protein
MTGAVPRPLAVVPLDETAQMGTNRINGVEGPGAIAVDAEDVPLSSADSRFVPSEVPKFAR